MAVNMGMRVLVVDDFKTMRRIVTNLMKQIGFNNIEDAIDGESALLKLAEKPFDLIISDWNMEPMSGYQLLQKIRAEQNNLQTLRTVPFVMITAESKPENVIKAKQAGVNNYIVKPFNADTLKSKLVAVLGEF